MGLGSDEAYWHTDSSFTETPISASLLHAIEVTDQGGETAFLDMYQAYDDMPPGLAARIEGKFANHSKVHNSGGTKRPEFADVTDPSKAPGVKHPMVRTHPVTNRKCLYLGRRLNSYIFDLPLDETGDYVLRVNGPTGKKQKVKVTLTPTWPTGTAMRKAESSRSYIATSAPRTSSSPMRVRSS